MSALQALYALFRENEIPMSDRNGGLHDIISAALAAAEKAEPFAYLVVQASGYIVGGWKDRETAEKIAAQQLARDSESVVEVYTRPPREAQADADPVAWAHDGMGRHEVISNDVKSLWLAIAPRKVEHYTIPLCRCAPRRESEPRRKPCTCHDTSRGPGRPCTVKAGGTLGELWQCVEEPRRESAELSDAPAWKDAQAQIREKLAAIYKRRESAELSGQEVVNAIANGWSVIHHSERLELSDEEIMQIRDDHLPSQGETFDCIAFARAVLRAAGQTRRESAWKERAGLRGFVSIVERLRQFAMELEGTDACALARDAATVLEEYTDGRSRESTQAESAELNDKIFAQALDALNRMQSIADMPDGRHPRNVLRAFIQLAALTLRAGSATGRPEKKDWMTVDEAIRASNYQATRDALRRLCDAADEVGVTHFDTDSLSREVIEMQDATKCARAVLNAPGFMPCAHNWASANNPAVKNAEVCVKCREVRAAGGAG